LLLDATPSVPVVVSLKVPHIFKKDEGGLTLLNNRPDEAPNRPTPHFPVFEAALEARLRKGLAREASAKDIVIRDDWFAAQACSVPPAPQALQTCVEKCLDATMNPVKPALPIEVLEARRVGTVLRGEILAIRSL
jgi:hypothetical protein